MAARALTKTEIGALTDERLLNWYRSLKVVRQNGRLESTYENPKRIRWCYHEARRELTKRGLKRYEVAV